VPESSHGAVRIHLHAADGIDHCGDRGRAAPPRADDGDGAAHVAELMVAERLPLHGRKLT